MTPKELKKLRAEVEAEIKVVKAELQKIAGENPAVKGDWKAHFHKNDPTDDTGEKARSVSEYEEEMAVEHSLETRLKELTDTLEKIDQGEYGNCARCSSPIDERRLQAMPAVKYCIECAKKTTYA